MDSKNKMLIDATHPEETRVVALRNGRVEEFDFESAARKLLRGNIYLAKVTRVEPSLQAAFIDYGGNRHGFLAFNEIHPDYYQIPVADREALKQEEAEAERWAEAEVEERARSRSGPRRRRRPRNDRGNGNGNGHGRQESREDLSAEVDTFEDGYQTSVASVDDVEQDQGASSAELRHEISPDDVRHAEVDHHESSPAREETTQPAHEHTAPGQAHHEHHGHEQQGQEHGAPEHAAPGHEPHSHGHQAEHSHAPEAHGHGPSVESTADLKAPEPHVEAAPEVRSADASPSSDWGPAEHYAAAPEYAAEARVAAPRHADADDADDHMDGNGHGAVEDDTVEQVSTEEDALEELPERPRRRARQYKIQEVIKRRQIMLVQVVKEERGNKGAALTTYISLAGRFTVLMPNTARGGGISRKITQPQDRKRLKAIAEELDVPEGMGLIIRTAGAARTKEEIKRDYEYLLRLWERVRDLTLSSTAPCVVYEEGNIIKRAIRDLYSKEFDQIVVAGESAHREAQDFMEMLMPGTGNQVASYRAPEPLFARYGIERQLNALFSPYVTLRSGGYIVINQTEALVSVDVNSGKSTREFSIEETALNTNLEAAEEIARQLKLRDLAGLIVVDFIDMEEKRNNRSVERRLKDALRHDRARIQVGRISHFGLLEMSRQRLRAGVLEGSTSQCPHCQGTGIIRSIESVALAVLRGLEDHLLKQATSVIAQTTAEVALYILNHKRAFITEMERRYGVIVRVEASDRVQGANFAVERFATPVSIAKPGRSAVSMEAGFDRDEDLADEADEAVAEPIAADVDHDGGDERGPRAVEGSEDERRGRRRRRRRGRRDREGEPRGETAAAGHALREAGESEGPAYEVANGAAGSDTSYDEGVDDLEPAEASEPLEPSVQEAGRTEGDGEGDGERRRGRRRGRRGGRSRRREGGEQAAPVAAGSDDDSDRHEWGIAEVARPGAEQPSASNPWHDRPVGLVGSADATAGGEERASPARPSIVEHVNEEASFAKSGAEALASAAALAGWQQTETAPAMPVAPPAAQPRPRPVEAAPVEPPVAEVTPIVPPEPFAAVAGHAVEAATEQPAAAHSSNGAYSHAEPAPEATPPAPTSVGPIETPEPQPARRGWWQRRFGSAE